MCVDVGARVARILWKAVIMIVRKKRAKKKDSRLCMLRFLALCSRLLCGLRVAKALGTT